MRPDGWRILIVTVLGAFVIGHAAVWADAIPAAAAKLAAKKTELSSEKKRVTLKEALGEANAVNAAAEAEPTDVKVEKTTLTGKFVIATKRSLSIELAAKDGVSDEILLKLAPDVMVGPNPIKSIKDLRAGDTVKVGYEQLCQTDDKGKKIVLSSTAKVVYLVERAAPSAPAATTAGGAQ